MSNAKPNPEHYDLRQIISWTCVNGLPLSIASVGMRVSETETAKGRLCLDLLSLI